MAHNATLSDINSGPKGPRRGCVGPIRIYVGGCLRTATFLAPTKRTMCVVCRPGSKVSVQTRSAARIVTLAVPSCQPRERSRFNNFAGSVCFPGTVAIAQCHFF